MGDMAPSQSKGSGTEQTGVMSSRAPSNQAAERLRVQELLRYFHPPSPGIDKDKPRVASDTSLTAYAQLCALKLDCQRSFISLIDHETQYIIAEATKTVSLETGDIDGEPDDAIYLGVTSLDIFWGVCPHTISVFTATDNSLNVNAPYVKASQSFYVMNDLSKVPGYENRPYVAGWPHMRYYAEVPIHSPSGLVIGSLCVVDNKPREGLDAKGIAVLREISHTVMDHLQLVMSKVQRQRAERMIHGLGLFIEGRDSLREWWMDSENGSRNIDPSKRRMTMNERADQEFGLQGNLAVNTSGTTAINVEKEGREIITVGLDNIDDSTPVAVSQSSTDPLEMLPTSPATGSIAMELLGSSAFSEDRITESNTDVITNGSMRKSNTMPLASRKGATITNSSGQKQPKLQSEMESMLARAANLIREAVSLSGVSFFDPPIGLGQISNYGGSFGGCKADETVEFTATVDRRGRNDQTLPDGTDRVSTPATLSTAPNEKACKLLASSTRLGSEKDASSALSLNLRERMLQRIIEKFPQGGVLKYDDRGLVSHGDLELAWYKTIPKAPEFSVSDKFPQNYSTDLDGSDLAEAQSLWRMLPGVQSIILFPLWDSSRDRLVSYNIAWTTDRTRVFHREDFAYLTSFCNSITSELSRLDTLAADRAKANFISSISHELRSPLHGMLASAELLKALTKDTTSIDIISTIETCGSTLLDTMENLLTFAKINDITVTQQREKSSANFPLPEQSAPQLLKSLIPDVDLGLLLEEVMNASISGHQFRKSLEMHSSYNFLPSRVTGDLNDPEDTVTVICDIDLQLNWMFATQPGVWKRIVTNLLGNSLKYTAAGFIHVSLSQEEHMVATHEPRKSVLCLVVEDSGKGISEEYMKHYLFTPFQQEDPLCPGTGLGLSIVHQLVASINGTINIQSEIGLGTRVEIKVILESPPKIESEGLTINSNNPVLPQSNTHKVGLVALDLYPDIQETSTTILSKQAKRSLVVKSSLTRAMKKSFGLEIITVASLDSEAEGVDILMTTESYFRKSHLISSRQRTLPLIVLCSRLTLDYRSFSNINGPVIYLSQPFGPRRLARALEFCIPYLGHEAATKSHLPRSLSIPMAISPDMKTLRQDSIYSPLSPFPAANNSSEKAFQRTDLPQVLLVEDNPINLKLLVTFLEKLGYHYATAIDGLKAVETYELAHGKLGIIFMDIQMPNMDGIAASYEIRQFEQRNRLKRTPIIALTGLASAEAQEQATLSGIDLFLTKPVPLKKLKAVLEDYLPSLGTNS